MLKRVFTLSLLFVLFIGGSAFSQSLRSFDVNPNLLPQEVKPNYPTTEATWDIQFNYDAVAVTGAAGNAGAVYIPTIGKFWTSRWATGIIHQWNSDGTLDQQYTLPFTGTRGMCFDGTFLYHSTSSTTVQIVDPATRTVVGTIPVVGAPNGFRFITYNPDGNAGAGSIIGGNWTAPNLNFYEFSMTGTLLRTITNAVTGVYGMAYDKWSPGGPFLWVWGQGAGAGTPQYIQQMDYTTGVYTGVQHDVAADIAPGIAGGLFIAKDLIPGFYTLGGMLQGNPGADRLFGYELTPSGGLPCPVGPATNPSPASGTTGVDPLSPPANATWTNGANTTQVEVFFGPVGNVVSVYSGAPITSLAIPTLQYATTYEWRVVCKNDTCSGIPVETWSFTTIQDPSLNVLFSDDFEAGAGLWTITHNPTYTCLITVGPRRAGYTLPGTGNVLAFDTDVCGSTTNGLDGAAEVTASLDASLYQTVNLEWDNDWQAIDADDFGYIEVSVDNGATWTPVKTFDVTDVRNTHEVLNISSAVALQVFKIRLRSVQPGWDWWWVVDNFKVIASGVVPVELASFAATTDNRNVNLNWSTATELNNSGFQIERSNGSEYQVVGFVAGHGTTSETQNYSYVDQNVNAGSYSYRLKQIDFNGAFEYSSVIEVEVLGIKEFALSQNYPNPFNPSTKINFSLAVDSKVSLKIFDVLGQEVATLINGQLAAGTQEISFDASSLNSGVYFYRIDADGIDGQKFSSVRKMILTK